MKLSGSLPVFFAAIGLALNLGAATDYPRRNEAFAPAASVVPAISRPEPESSIQGRRPSLRTAPLEKTAAVLGERRAPIAVDETHAKKVTVPDRQQLHPASRTPDLSPLNRQPARLSTTDDSRRPALVAKYQDRLSAANTVTVGRTPAVDRGGAARLNRFVFRHNPPEPLPTPAAAAPVRGAAPADER